jgi:hypothetical protein
VFLVEVGEGRQLDIDRSPAPAYPKWPDLRGGCYDTVAPSLLCAEALRQALRLDDEEALWVSPYWVAEYTGLGQRAVDLRVRAALLGVAAAWPWTRVRKDRHVYLPDLWEETIWVSGPHVRAYLGLAPRAYYLALDRGQMTAEYRPFRGIDRYNLRRGQAPRRNAVRLPDVLRYQQLLALRKLFGQRFSYKQLELLFDLDPTTVARLRAGRLLAPRTGCNADE